MKKYVAGFMFCKGCVALVTKANPEWQRGLLNAVGGKVEPGETGLEAMVREFKEETGMTTALSSWKTVCFLRGRDSADEEWEVHFFKSVVKHMMSLHGSLVEPVSWYSIRDLVSGTVPNLRWLIPLALYGDDLNPSPEFNQRTPV